MQLFADATKRIFANRVFIATAMARRWPLASLAPAAY
jgi:hypothetical protein